MVYIVSDERIAVENFEQGKIYKVVFVDESILYGVCIGIGSDFVMLSGDISGYIFPLTMQTASQVSSIDLYDPTPPEPPVPWTNLLQYLTGVPPFEFTTTDTNLFSWYIEGEGVGDKTENLWANLPNRTAVNVDISSENGVIHFTNTATSSFNVEYSIELSAGRYTIKANANRIPANDENACIQVYNGSAQVYAKVNNNAAINGTTTFTINQNLTVSLRIRLQNGVDYTGFELRPTLNSGSTAIDFEPYGYYKIPVICNEHTTNIYLDAPLSEGEILYSTDIDTAIVTDIGENELTVGTTQQPTSMQIVYKIADR